MTVETRYDQHPIARKHIPQSTEEEIQRIRSSIARAGFDKRYPIWLYEGKVLVGWTRYRAALAENTSPSYKEFIGEDPTDFVIRSEIDRRHVAAVHRLRLMETARPALEEEAAKRQRTGTSVEAELPHGRTVEIIAAAVGVSPRTAQDYHAVQESGTKELQKAVDRQEVSISDAAKLARTATPTQQDRAVSKVKEGKARTLAQAAKRKPKNGQVVFDKRQITDALGKIVRLMNAYAEVKGDSQEVRDAFDLFAAAWKRWSKD